ncbi:MAG: 30S ribosomal protein S20 [Desulfobacterales bacterium]|nr:30S ribosomal protein S20 [Desulfobacterales bacterium]MBF0398202.1 30S ribosomal protein S20 [Desulfobacterales bacterium]
MANHKSAIKQARQNEKKRARNRAVKTRVKNIIKEVKSNASEKTIEAAKTNLNSAQSLIQKAANKGVIHKRAASRKISRLSKLINKTISK